MLCYTKGSNYINVFLFYGFLKIPSWNIVTASAFCLPDFVQIILFDVIQLK